MKEKGLLEGQVAIVTGAGRGIGKAIAMVLADEGCKVALCGRTASYLEEVCSTILNEGGEAAVFPVDVSDASQIKNSVDNIIDKFGEIDILVNNAGVTRDKLLIATKEKDWDFVLDTNLKGMFLFTKAALKPMLKKRSGKIVNLSSISAMVGNAGQTTYSASKAGVMGFSKSLAKEVASRNIRVNVVAPGFIDTNMTGDITEEMKGKILDRIPQKCFGQPEDVAQTVLFLSSNMSRYMTGQVLTVDGGMGA